MGTTLGNLTPHNIGQVHFRHKFLCVFGHVFDALSNGIKIFYICRLRNLVAGRPRSDADFNAS